MDDRSARLLAAVRDASVHPGTRHDAWQRLFEHDPAVASSAAFDLLAGEPRIKPSRALVVDPGDSVRRRWELRVAAAAALLASPLATGVFDEVRDELAEDADLCADVLNSPTLSAELTGPQRDELRRLGPAPADHAATSPS